MEKQAFRAVWAGLRRFFFWKKHTSRNLVVVYAKNSLPCGVGWPPAVFFPEKKHLRKSGGIMCKKPTFPPMMGSRHRVLSTLRHPIGHLGCSQTPVWGLLGTPWHHLRSPWRVPGGVPGSIWANTCETWIGVLQELSGSLEASIWKHPYRGFVRCQS